MSHEGGAPTGGMSALMNEPHETPHTPTTRGHMELALSMRKGRHQASRQPLKLQTKYFCS